MDEFLNVKNAMQYVGSDGYILFEMEMEFFKWKQSVTEIWGWMFWMQPTTYT